MNLTHAHCSWQSRVTDLMPDPVLIHNTCFHPCVLEPTHRSEGSQRERLVMRLVSCLLSRPLMGSIDNILSGIPGTVTVSKNYHPWFLPSKQ